jgi:hypothetical protein
LGHGKLADEDRGLVAVAILDDRERISAPGFADPDEPPVVDHDDLDPGDSGEQARVGAVYTAPLRSGAIHETWHHGSAEGGTGGRERS